MKEKFDRSQFVGGKISSIKKSRKKAKEKDKSFYKKDGYVGFHNIEDGKNWFRVAPSHSRDSLPYEPVRTTMLKCKVNIYKDGEKTEETEIKNKKIFIATQHTPYQSDGTPLLKEDPVELYIKYVFEEADSKYSSSKEDRQRFLNPITGFRAKSKWVPGIRPTTEFVCYAWDEDWELARLSLNSYWMKKMESISLDESDDDVMGVDIFSDPDEGQPLIIKKYKDDYGKTNYSIEVEKPNKRESWEEFFRRVRISDEKLLELSEVKPLKELFVGVYSERDFNLAIEGLRRFDEENGYQIFENDDFIEELEKLSELVPEEKKSESEEYEENEKNELTNPKEKDKRLTPFIMKKILREYIKENYGDDYELPNLSSDNLKKWYELAISEDELPFENNIKSEESSLTSGAEKKVEGKLEKTDADVNSDVVSDLRAKLQKMRESKK